MEGAHVKESSQHSIDDLNVRSKEVFRLLVESYLDTGDPVGSRTCLLYTSPSPRDVEESRMPSSA